MPAGLHVELKGLEDAEKQMKRIERGAKAMEKYRGFVSSALPYAYGAEYGRHPQGKLARKAGGAFYMRRAVDEVLSGADFDLSEGLNKVTAPGKWTMKRLTLWARRLARKYAPRKKRGLKKSHNYRLWRSIRGDVRPK